MPVEHLELCNGPCEIVLPRKMEIFLAVKVERSEQTEEMF